jgi:alpha-amylase
MSNVGPGQRKMFVGKQRAGEIWTDLLGWEETETKIDDEGWGIFNCPGVSVAIWVNKVAKGREQFPVEFDTAI